MAFDSNHNRFLVTWVYVSPSNPTITIDGQFIGLDGAPIGQSFQVSESIQNSSGMKPHIAYSPASDRFLAAWHDYRRALWTIDAATGAITEGGDYWSYIGDPRAMTFDEANDRLLTADYNNGTLFSVDPVTGSRTLVGTMPDNTSLVAMALDPNTRTLYGAQANSNSPIYAINPDDATGSLLGNASGTSIAITGMAFDSNNDILYGFGNSTNSLYTIDTTDGSATLIGAVGFTNVHGLAFDAASDTLYGVDISPGQLITINTSTGEGTEVGTLGTVDIRALAFDSNAGELRSFQGSSTRAIAGQMINSDGTLAGGNFAISTVIGTAGGVNGIAHDSDNDRFLVVMVKNNGSDNDIIGQLINPDGTLFGTTADQNLAISSATTDQNSPAAAFDSANNRFLVTWQDNRNANSDIFGQLVNADGTLFDQDGNDTPDPVADNFPISNQTGFQYQPSVDFDPATNRFLVAWDDSRSDSWYDIYGQVINADGTTFGQDAATNFAITNVAGSHQMESSVELDPSTGRFLVGWGDYRGAQTSPYGQLVNSDGTLVATALDGTTIPGTVSNTNFVLISPALTDPTNAPPSLVYSPYCENFIIANIIGGGNNYLQVDPAMGGCTQIASLYYPDGNATGVTAGATAGDDFTFEVNFWGGAAPTSMELWIDRDGDGNFAAAGVLAPLVAGGGNMPPGLPGVVAALLLGLWLAAFLLTRRHPALRPAFAVVTLVLAVGLVALGGITACDSSSSSTEVADDGDGDGDGDGSTTAGITVDPTTGLVTTEAGGTDTFTVVLDTEPTEEVSIAIGSSDSGEGTVSPVSLTFTSEDWETAQTVTVTGVNDNLEDGDIAYDILTAPAESLDSDYSGLNADDVAVTNSDDDTTSNGADTAGITVDAATALVTTEAGGTATFTVVLDLAPAEDVTLGLISSDTGEGTVSPASLVFTSDDWDTARTVTVTGVDDDVDDGDIAYTIATAAAFSGDADYDGMDADDVAVTNSDDDAAGITVTPATGLITTEMGGTATFTVVLDSEPTADVIIGLISSDPGEGTVSPASLTFTATNWDTARTVTVTGVHDWLLDGGQPYTVTTAAAVSDDADYSGLNTADVALTNSDSGAAERNAMVEADAMDTDTTDGKLYTVTVPIWESGSYNYKFVFKDDGGAVVTGGPATEVITLVVP